MNRHRLPTRRQGWTIDVPHPDPGSRIVYTVKIGFDESGPREVFISCNKLTTAMHVAGLEIAVLISIALQRGATFEELAAALPREGKGVGQPQGAAGAILDAVMAQMSEDTR